MTEQEKEELAKLQLETLRRNKKETTNHHLIGSIYFGIVSLGCFFLGFLLFREIGIMLLPLGLIFGGYSFYHYSKYDNMTN